MSVSAVADDRTGMPGGNPGRGMHPPASEGAARGERSEPKADPSLDTSAAAFPASSEMSPRAYRYAMREGLRTLTKMKSVRECGAVPVATWVSLRGDANGARGGYGGLKTCSSAWACPCCAAKISAHRQGEVADVITAAVAAGAYVSMLTLTQRHHQGQGLKPLWLALSSAWNRVTSGRRWLEFKEQLGLIGYIKAVEVTHGSFGWHVHCHVLVLSERPPEATPIFFQRKQGRRRQPYPVEFTMPATFIAERWSDGLAKHGVNFLADTGMDWSTAAAGDEVKVGAYVSKLGFTSQADGLANEATLGSFKKARGENRTPFQILEDILRAPKGSKERAADTALWHEWEKGSFGKRALTWSAGLRQWAQLEREKTDEEITDEEPGDGVVALFDHLAWKKVRKAGAGQLLDAMEAGGHQGAYDWLAQNGIHYQRPPSTSACLGTRTAFG